MKQERLDVLERVYNEAIEFNSMDSGIIVGLDELVESNFDIQYLEKAEYIEVKFEGFKRAYITITAKGVDVVERMQEKEDDDEYITLIHFDGYEERMKIY
ncbi:hypothetical protein [Bacillus seohaeanensis]|uniref:Uncharacterized protein n=1 Tax=Bacillus seohaeanensis TaxID=284580 RepID=A0ABW5RSA5_9BACI